MKWRPPSLILLILVLASSALAGASTIDLRDFDPETPGLPWLFLPKPEYSVSQGQVSYKTGTPFLIANLDDDPDDEFVMANHDYIVLKKFKNDQFLIQKQCNFPIESSASDSVGPGFALAGPYDLDGDGKREIVAWGYGSDKSTWDFFIVDVDAFEILHSFQLTRFQERQPDDVWDGFFSVIGELPGVLDDPRSSALVLTVSVERDCYGRGILAVNPFTGETLWHFESGLEPLWSKSHIADLDDDGRNEIYFLGRGADNLGGEIIGDYSDNQTRLLALNDRGSEIWSRQLADGWSTGEMTFGDVDGIPGTEFVTITRVISKPNSVLQVWNQTGALLDEMEFETSGSQIGLLPRKDGPGQDIVFTSRDMALRVVRLENDRLVLKRKGIFPNVVSLSSIFPMGERGRPHIMTVDRSNRALILDGDLQVVASFPDQVTNGSWNLEHFFHPRSTILIRKGRGANSFEIVPNPDALPANAFARFLVTRPLWFWLLGLLLAATGILWRQLHRKHRREIEARAVIPGDRDNLREARLHLLEDLELSGHGAIAPLRSLRRLLWLLDALKTGIDFNEEMNSRFREIWQDCHQDDLPRLLVILDRARAARLDLTLIDSATKALQNIQLHLARFRKVGFAVAELDSASEDLHANGDVAENSLQKLRHEVADLFTADLRQVIKKVLRANGAAIEEMGITIQMGQLAAAQAGGAVLSPDPEAPTLCRMDPTELGFILDNLVGNAVRAMSGASTRRLQISWQPVNGLVKVEVSDTGVGIADEDLDRILESPFSTREGGGLGLPKSVRILRKYGGSLSIKSSSPGKGTTFQVLVPLAR